MSTRPIKFRARRLDNEEWVYGYAVYGRENQLAWIITEGYEATYGPNPDQNIFRVDPATVGQFIGRTDMTGREMYVGDRFSSVWGSREQIYVISSLEEAFDSDQLGYVLARDNIKVIGTIHDRQGR
jgi:hypothetical protein